MDEELLSLYTKRYYGVLQPLANNLYDYLISNFSSNKIDLISTRPKGIESFINKSEKTENGLKKYTDPLSQIQDQIGARIVTIFKSDLQVISGQVDRLFARIEKSHMVPDNNKSFGYESIHYMLFIPEDVKTDDIDLSNGPEFFELQIATLFQHAWAQANHNLGYKPTTILTNDQERKIAFTAAQAWGADQIFDELSVMSAQEI